MSTHTFMVCIDNRGYEASLEIRKIYETMPDPDAMRHNHVRIIDESGEDYLYPESMFARIELSDAVIEQLIRAA